MNFVRTVAALAAAAVMVSCHSVTPADRIAANPIVFNSLSPQQKLLVEQGRICEGMTTEAVRLAWGSPSNVLQGQKKGHSFEQWQYVVQEPVTTSYPEFGGCWGPYPYHRYCYPHYGMGMGTTFIPRVTAQVTFEKGVVTEWVGGGRR